MKNMNEEITVNRMVSLPCSNVAACHVAVPLHTFPRRGSNASWRCIDLHLLTSCKNTVWSEYPRFPASSIRRNTLLASAKVSFQQQPEASQMLDLSSCCQHVESQRCRIGSFALCREKMFCARNACQSRVGSKSSTGGRPPYKESR